MIAYALVTFCAAFLGCYLAGLLSQPKARRSNLATPQRFPHNLGQGVDLDELDRPTKGSGDL